MRQQAGRFFLAQVFIDSQLPALDPASRITDKGGEEHDLSDFVA
jgi:hypothetical protein